METEIASLIIVPFQGIRKFENGIETAIRAGKITITADPVIAHHYASPGGGSNMTEPP